MVLLHVLVRDALARAISIIPQQVRAWCDERRTVSECHVVEEDKHLQAAAAGVVVPSDGDVNLEADVIAQVEQDMAIVPHWGAKI